MHLPFPQSPTKEGKQTTVALNNFYLKKQKGKKEKK